MRTLLVATVVLSFVFNAANAYDQSSWTQTAPSPPATPVAESVSIYITAATKQGAPLTDLRPDDLTITEDKIGAKIEKISCGKPDPILLGVLVDVSGSRRVANLSFEYDALQAFLNQILSGRDGEIGRAHV